MISEDFIDAWQEHANWQTSAQIEQDLVISRALIDLYSNPYIKDALVFRGGTALNKLYIVPGARYSEDIDFVQKRAEGIGPIIDAIRSVLRPWLGEPIRKITQRGVKLIYKYESIQRNLVKLKIEINTTEHFQVLPLKGIEFHVDSEWFKGFATIITYEIDELMATKLRALYQRRKGRDLFDLWYVSSLGLINVEKMLEVFSKYCEYDGTVISGQEFMNNLNQKKTHPEFHVDMHPLLPIQFNWDFEQAYQYVVENILSKLP